MLRTEMILSTKHTKKSGNCFDFHLSVLSIIESFRDFRVLRGQIKNWQIACLFLSLLGQAAPCNAIESTPLLQKFVAKMVKQHHFEASKLNALLKSAKLRTDIIKAMTRPAESHTPWYQYQQQFVTEQRIIGGVQFWQQNQPALTEIAQQYGVPAEIIVAIIGVETDYGQNIGRYRVLDALATLGFFYPQRSAFFLTELENFLLLCREEKLNPLLPVGSYAGAMGMAQFIPSSVRTYAVDYDHDKRRDIWHNHGDIIASVGHYLAKYGWKRGEAIVYPVTAKGQKYQQALLSQTLLPDFSLAQLQALNVAVPAKTDLKLRAKLLRFEQQQAVSLWLGLNNFYVITRYNHSALYAMAVYQLSAAIFAKKGIHP